MNQIVFYISSIISILSALGVIFSLRPMYGVFNLLICFISLSMIYFLIGAPFAACLQIIVYAGAIMIIFAFIIMMMNLGKLTFSQEKEWLPSKGWYFPVVMALILFVSFLIFIGQERNGLILGQSVQSSEKVGSLLFGPYLLLADLAAYLLLAALLAASHIGHYRRQGDHS